MVGEQMSDHLTEQMPKVWGGSINGDAEGCKPSAYGTPDSISGHPTNQHVIQRVGEPGRPRNPWKVETGGSNPPTLTNSIRDSRRRRNHTRSHGNRLCRHAAALNGIPYVARSGCEVPICRSRLEPWEPVR